MLTRRIALRLRAALQDAWRLIHDQHQRTLFRWRLKRGDATLRVTYPLTTASIVFDVGGYIGEWAQQIVDRYGCNVHVFEPVVDLAEVIKSRFAEDPRVTVHAVGLSDRNKQVEIFLGADSSSMFKEAPGLVRASPEEVRITSVKEFLDSHGIEFVDLIKINIEGGEYDLLGHLIESGLVRRFGNIQVQFHNFVPGAKEEMQRLQSLLTATHTPTYRFPFVWENWRLISDPG